MRGRGRGAPRWLGLAALLWIAAILAAIVPLLDEGTDGGPLRAVPLPESKCAGPQVGVHSALAFERASEARAEHVAAIEETLDAQVVRDSLLWDQIEPEEGRRDWSHTDSVVAELREAGIEPLLVVVGSPSWANGAPESEPGQYLHVPPRGAAFDAWLRDYSRFLATAVGRYRDYVRRWEIWNEPNLDAFWRPRPDPVAYRRVYEKLRATILRVDPDAQVAVGGLAGLTTTAYPSIPGLDFLRDLLRMRPPIDNVAIHPYTTDDHPPDVHFPGQNNFDGIERVREVLAAARVRASIWVTEWGWSSAAVGERRQARYVKRSLELLMGRFGFVEVATYFVDRDRPPRFFQGLLDESLEPKPAAAAFRRQARLAASRCQQRPAQADGQRARNRPLGAPAQG